MEKEATNSKVGTGRNIEHMHRTKGGLVGWKKADRKMVLKGGLEPP